MLHCIQYKYLIFCIIMSIWTYDTDIMSIFNEFLKSYKEKTEHVEFSEKIINILHCNLTSSIHKNKSSSKNNKCERLLNDWKIKFICYNCNKKSHVISNYILSKDEEVIKCNKTADKKNQKNRDFKSKSEDNESKESDEVNIIISIQVQMLTYINTVISSEEFIICDFSIIVHVFRNKTYFIKLRFIHHVTIESDSKDLECKEEDIICFKLIIDSMINILTLQNTFYVLSIPFNIVSTESL